MIHASAYRITQLERRQHVQSRVKWVTLSQTLHRAWLLSHTSLCPLRGRQDSLQHARCGWIMSYCWHHTNHRLNPAGQKSVLLLQCGQRQSSYTPNSTAARRRNWRRRPYSPCRLDSWCNGDREDEELFQWACYRLDGFAANKHRIREDSEVKVRAEKGWFMIRLIIFPHTPVFFMASLM